MFRIIVALFLIFLPNAMAAEELARRMTLTGLGQVYVAPDMATISLGVSSYDKKAAKAMRMNSNAMARVFKELKDAGVEGKDVQTSQLSLNPRWARETSNNIPRITGYEAVNTVTVRVRELATVGDVLDVLTQAGANRINNISFGIQKPRPHQDEARKRAVADARAKAELYAGAAGIKIGKIISIIESGSIPQPRQMARMEMASMAADAIPVAEGELELRSTITIIYEIE